MYMIMVMMMMNVSHRKTRLGNRRGIFATVPSCSDARWAIISRSANQLGADDGLSIYSRFDVLQNYNLVETTWERIELEVYIFSYMAGA
jgi:hypothetical protein